jgi:hypothetical protein
MYSQANHTCRYILDVLCFIGFQTSPERIFLPSSASTCLFCHNRYNFLEFLWHVRFFGIFFRSWILELFLPAQDFESIYSCSTPDPVRGGIRGGGEGVDTGRWTLLIKVKTWIQNENTKHLSI